MKGVLSTQNRHTFRRTWNRRFRSPGPDGLPPGLPPGRSPGRPPPGRGPDGRAAGAGAAAGLFSLVSAMIVHSCGHSWSRSAGGEALERDILVTLRLGHGFRLAVPGAAGRLAGTLGHEIDGLR